MKSTEKPKKTEEPKETEKTEPKETEEVKAEVEGEEDVEAFVESRRPALLQDKEASELLVEVATEVAKADLATAALFETLGRWVEVLEAVVYSFYEDSDDEEEDEADG